MFAFTASISIVLIAAVLVAKISAANPIDNVFDHSTDRPQHDSKAFHPTPHPPALPDTLLLLQMPFIIYTRQVQQN